MSRAALVALLLLAGACKTTELERKEIAIQTALDAAFLACQTALNDSRMKWEPGSREYCLRVTNTAPDCSETLESPADANQPGAGNVLSK